MSEKNATARYLETVASQPLDIVAVKVPSGFVFKFKRPSKFSLIFGAGELPQNAISEAVEQWEKDGIVSPEKTETETDTLRIVTKMLEIRDRVLELSYEPKLVIGKAKKDNELSTDHVADKDLDYLFKWVQAGGDASAMLAMFPEGREQSVVAGIDSPKLRNAR